MEKLLEGEMICPVCNGTGEDKHSVYVCEKCDGNGKVDWVSNAITRHKTRTSLDIINVKRVVTQLKSFVSRFKFGPIDNITLNSLHGIIENYLSTLHSRKIVKDYKITKNPNNMTIDVIVKPIPSVDVIRIEYKLEYNK